jgi:uncharacterized membrane protein
LIALLQFLADFLGHFHPVVVHLPIGILLIAALFHFLARTNKFQALRPAVSVSIFLGMLFALVAALTGFLLSTTDDYDADTVSWHQWLGFATAFVAFVAYLSERRNFKYQSWLLLLLVVLITVTGHLGGTLTHGDGYLTQAFKNTRSGKIKPIANVQEALVYEDVIRPILETKCYGCHSNRKQKGGLRLDEKTFILRGGKNGVVVIPGDIAKSELINRIFLPNENEDHMPPKEKPQPTISQKDLLKWWIASGAPFDKKIRDMDQPADVRSMLAVLSAGETNSKPSSNTPEAPVGEAPSHIVDQLRKHGVAVLEVGQNSNYLSANLINVNPSNDSLTQLLLKIDKQLVWLKTGSYPIDGEALSKIGKLHALTRLQLGNLTASRDGLNHLAELKNLQYLNLTGVEITPQNANALKGLVALNKLFLFQCQITPSLYTELRTALPGVAKDTGGYQVPTLESDTTEVTVGKE